MSTSERASSIAGSCTELEREHVVALGLRAQGVVENELRVQRRDVRIDHHFGRRALAVDALGHAVQVDFRARARDRADSLAHAIEIGRHTAGVEQALVPDLHLGVAREGGHVKRTGPPWRGHVSSSTSAMASISTSNFFGQEPTTQNTRAGWFRLKYLR